MAKSKTYSTNVFSHKKGVWGGLDDSKGKLYRGDTVPMSLNVVTDENVFKPRRGLRKYAVVDTGIISAGNTVRYSVVSTGSKVFFGTTVPTSSDFRSTRVVSFEEAVLGISLSGEIINTRSDTTEEASVGISLSGEITNTLVETTEELGFSTSISGELGENHTVTSESAQVFLEISGEYGKPIHNVSIALGITGVYT